MESKWINVGISYPEYNVNVLLTDGRKVGFGWLAKDGKSKHWKSHQDLGWITHWMALPEPPKQPAIHMKPVTKEKFKKEYPDVEC